MKGTRRPQPQTRRRTLSQPRKGQLRAEAEGAPPGVQGANVGYWQAVGVTRAAAKRSKRP
jgi:hypothetical protein